MKIKYKYITGEVAEVEVSDEIGIEIETPYFEAAAKRINELDKENT